MKSAVSNFSIILMRMKIEEFQFELEPKNASYFSPENDCLMTLIFKMKIVNYYSCMEQTIQ